jgi:hypothetical protein
MLALEQTTKIRRPAYAREVIAALRAGQSINLCCFVGQRAWDCAREYHGGKPGDRLVVTIDYETQPEDYDFEFLLGQDLVLKSLGFDLVLSQRIARRICAHGARMCVLLHPALELPQFFYGAQS